MIDLSLSFDFFFSIHQSIIEKKIEPFTDWFRDCQTENSNFFFVSQNWKKIQFNLIEQFIRFLSIIIIIILTHSTPLHLFFFDYYLWSIDQSSIELNWMIMTIKLSIIIVDLNWIYPIYKNDRFIVLFNKIEFRLRLTHNVWIYT